MKHEENDCGTWSWYRFRYYDLCQYVDKAKPSNLAKTWQEKTEELMSLVNADKRSGKIIGIQGTNLKLL